MTDNTRFILANFLLGFGFMAFWFAIAALIIGYTTNKGVKQMEPPLKE